MDDDIFDGDIFGNLPDFNELPEIPDLEDLFEPERHCPVCVFLEQHVCRPFMTHGDPRVCSEEIKSVRDATVGMARDERVQEITKVFEKYGIDPNARLGPG